MEDLTDAQKKSLDDFQQIVASEDAQNARDVLERNDWHIESAVSSVYDQDASASQVDEPLLGAAHGQRRSAASNSPRASAGTTNTGFSRIFSQPFSTQASPFRIVLLPFYWLFRLGVSLFAFVFTKVFRIRPNVPNFSFNLDAFGFSKSLRGQSQHYLSPHDASVATIHQLETDLQRLDPSALHNINTAYSSSVAAGPSSSSSRRPVTQSDSSLPEFHVGSYDSALNACKSKLQPLLVILYSEEHEAYEDFLRVISNPNMIRGLQEERVMVWIGNVGYSDAYTASDVLESASLPFYAFITPAAPSTPANGARKPLVFSRLEGSPLSTTSAESIISHLTSVFLPRIKPTLSRLEREQQHREAERRMRAEQDAAYAEAARADVARIKAKQQAAEREKQEAEQRKIEEAEASRRAEWRGWLKNNLPQESASGAKLSIKLPDGRTLTRKFDPTTKLEVVYHWVECAALPCEDTGRDMSSANFSIDFKLLQLFPKQVLEQQVSLAEAGLSRGGNLVVEGLKLPSEEDSDEEVEDSE